MHPQLMFCIHHDTEWCSRASHEDPLCVCSYRRFNHFDELSGRFWLRSWAESADSLDNPAFTRSDELLHLRALDRPCCYHDDTLSLASTCPSHGARINTIYPHRYRHTRSVSSWVVAVLSSISIFHVLLLRVRLSSFCLSVAFLIPHYITALTTYSKILFSRWLLTRV